MLRNKEYQSLLIVTFSIIILTTGISFMLFSKGAVVLIVLTSVLLVGCFIWYTNKRYRDIEQLSGYLRKISSGEYHLDVRDNEEGELSILKNEIYKVTVKLSEQKNLLQQDKLLLMNAISDISHQLKTPLTSMIMMVDLLNDSKMSELKRTEFTGHLRNQLERMEWLLTSLLKLSKIDSGTVSFKTEIVDVKKVIKKSIESILIPIDIKEQRLIINGEDSVSFNGDINWTAEALINILKNAVEHTEIGGQIEINFSDNILFTEIAITDSGNGIPKNELPYIFNRFYKGKNTSKDSVGIGLALAYAIIKNQNGDIEVLSERSKGTKFTIKFYKNSMN